MCASACMCECVCVCVRVSIALALGLDIWPISQSGPRDNDFERCPLSQFWTRKCVSSGTVKLILVTQKKFKKVIKIKNSDFGSENVSFQE